MKDRFDKIDEKLEKIDARLDAIDITLTRNTETLIVHERRSTNLENQIIPIRNSYQQLIGITKFIAVMGGVATLILSLLQILK